MIMIQRNTFYNMPVARCASVGAWSGARAHGRQPNRTRRRRSAHAIPRRGRRCARADPRSAASGHDLAPPWAPPSRSYLAGLVHTIHDNVIHMHRKSQRLLAQEQTRASVPINATSCSQTSFQISIHHYTSPHVSTRRRRTKVTWSNRSHHVNPALLPPNRQHARFPPRAPRARGLYVAPSPSLARSLHRPLPPCSRSLAARRVRERPITWPACG